MCVSVYVWLTRKNDRNDYCEGRRLIAGDEISAEDIGKLWVVHPPAGFELGFKNLLWSCRFQEGLWKPLL